MKRKQFTILILAATLALVLALAISGTVGAQDSARPFLGIGLRSADNGILVETVVSDGPAAKAGVKEGDIITAVGGKAVTANTISEVMKGFTVGETVTLSVTRGDEKLELKATLTEAPVTTTEQSQRQTVRPWVGVRLEDTDAGPTIREVVADSPAASAELKSGDVIQKINGETVADAQAVQRLVRAAKVGDTLSIEVLRDGKSQSFDVTLAELPVSMLQLPGTQAMPFADTFGIIYNANEQTWGIRNLGETSALYKAGLREGDVITAFDGTQYDPAGLQKFLAGLESNAEVKLSVKRGNEALDVSVPAADLQTFGVFGLGGFFGRELPGRDFDLGQMMGGIRLGVQYVTLNQQEATERKLTQTEGALITDIITDSPAEKAGLKVNDIVTAVNGDKLDEERTLRDRLLAYEAGDKVTLDVVRDGQTRQIEVTLEAGSTMGGMMDLLPFFEGHGMQIPGFPEMPQFQTEPAQPAPNA